MALSGPFRLRDLVRDKTGFTVRPEVPTGVLYPYAGSTAPSGYLLCDGSAISRTTYSALFAVLSTTYGAGDGSTTFNLPDCRGRMPVGAGNDGTAANNATRTRGDKGGDTRMPTHNHSITDPGHVHTYGVYGGSFSGGGAAASNFTPYGLAENRSTSNNSTNITGTNNQGSGTGENMPPFVVTNYIIKT